MTEKKKRLVLISDGIPNQLYLTDTELSEDDLSALMTSETTVKLTECYMLRTLMVPTPKGIVAENLVTSIGVFRGATTIYVKPISFMFPDQDDATDERLRSMIKNCQENEIRNRAADAGLVTAHPAPPNPDGLHGMGR